MGITGSNEKCGKRTTTVMLIVGSPHQSKLKVSFDFLIKHFGYFRKKNCLSSCDVDQIVSFHFPTIAKSVMLNVLDFFVKGKYYCNINVCLNYENCHFF